MVKVLGSFIVFLVVLFLPQSAVAAYILPYPSYMPGNKLYRVMRIFDEVKKYWHWGNLSSYRYLLGQSDKALVEAKTLFEYRQYLLAINALERSNAALQRVPETLQGAKAEGKNIEKYEREFGEAKEEHMKIIGRLLSELPEEFIWRAEWEKPQMLQIHEELNRSARLRK